MSKALYIKIYDDIKNLIKSKTLLPGDPIPSELELRKKYNCSRDTVRKATLLLEQKNYIYKSQGKPSIVLENTQYLFPTSTLESFKELAVKNNLSSKTKCVSIREIDKSSLADLSDIESDKVTELIRVRNINGENIVLDIDYLDSNKVPYMDKEIAENSIYEYIEGQLGLNISYSKKIVVVENANKQDLELLDISDDDLVVVVKSFVYLDNGKCFQYSISRHRSDKFVFTAYASR